MASSGDVQAVVPAEPGVEVEQPAVEACCEGGSGSSATTTKEESVMAVLQEQRDTEPEPDHHKDDAATPHEQAADVSASDEPDDEKPAPVAKEEAEHKAPDEGDHHQESTRERLKQHRMEVAGRVWVPEKWGQEKLLMDWVDCAVFDRPLVPAGLVTAQRALVAESCTRPPDRTSSTVSSPAPDAERVLLIDRLGSIS